MKEAYQLKYNELLKKHELLNKRYDQLEKLEEELNQNTTMSDEKRIENLDKLAQEYEKISILMKEVADQAKELQEKIEKEIDE